MDIELLREVGTRVAWDTHDIITLLDFTYSLFRAHVINAETMNTIVSWLWTLVLA